MTKEENKRMVYTTIILSKPEMQIIKDAGFPSLQDFILACIKSVKDNALQAEVKDGEV